MKTNRLFTLLLPLIALATFTASCVFAPTEPIEPHYVAAERGTFDVIKPAAVAYLQADGVLADAARLDRLKQFADWQASIAAGEANPDGVLKTAHIAAERKAFDQITPWYLAYIEADPGLSDSQKESRTDTVLAWEFALKRAERAAGITRGPPDE
jgi:hypothetical protein